MSNETVLGILISVILAIGGYLLVNKKFKLNIKQKSKSGNNTISNSIIGNEINHPKK
jgi:hypothetical protein